MSPSGAQVERNKAENYLIAAIASGDAVLDVMVLCVAIVL